MGSAQSARRIQPGGEPGRAGGPADLSRSPFLPTPPPALPPPLAALPSVSGRRRAAGGFAGVGGRGRGWGRRGTAPRPATGRRRAHFHRGGAPRPAPGRLGRPAGKVARGGCPAVVTAAGPPFAPSVTAPRQQRSPNPGAEGASPLPPRSPPLPALPPRGGAAPREGGVPRGARAGVSGGAGPPLPRRDRSPTPARLLTGVGRGGADCPQCAPGGSRRRARGVAPRSPRSERTGSAAMSATHPTRLETRTKESNTCASQGLARKPPWRNEGEGRPRRRPRWDPEASPSPPRAHHRPVSPAAPGRWSMSARVRTRKMVNYAWAGRSQSKLWWRSVAVLTCKSVVRPGYRGERLIEPSSSWFPPKFPSG